MKPSIHHPHISTITTGFTMPTKAMRHFHHLLAVLLQTSFGVAASLPNSVTIWSWPLSASSPSPLATVNYDPISLNTSVAAYTPPKDLPLTPPPNPGTLDLDGLVRIGLYDSKAGASSWNGTITHASSFNPKHQHQLSLVLTSSGQPLSVSFAAFAENIDPREERRRQKREERQRRREEEAKAKGKEPKSKAGRASAKKKEESRKKEQPLVEVTKQREGPLPVLNKPVQLNSEGRVEQKDEKTFLQKYWWAIAIFLVLQLLTAGGGGEGGGK